MIMVVIIDMETILHTEFISLLSAYLYKIFSYIFQVNPRALQHIRKRNTHFMGQLHFCFTFYKMGKRIFIVFEDLYSHKISFKWQDLSTFKFASPLGGINAIKLKHIKVRRLLRAQCSN
jgi:hypothetical protein